MTKTIRYALILIVPIIPLSCAPIGATTEPTITDTIWIISSDDVRILQLPSEAYGCAAVPPYFCQEIDGTIFVVLVSEGLPPQSSIYTHINYRLGEDDEYIQPIDNEIYNLTVLAPTHAPFLWIFVIMMIFLLKMR